MCALSPRVVTKVVTTLEVETVYVKSLLKFKGVLRFSMAQVLLRETIGVT
jgi:hypothetical protein